MRTDAVTDAVIPRAGGPRNPGLASTGSLAELGMTAVFSGDRVFSGDGVFSRGRA